MIKQLLFVTSTMVFGYSTIRLIVCVYRYSAAEPHLADARTWARGGQLLCLGATLRRPPLAKGRMYLWKSTQLSV